mmetsp:Transcript_5650/g.15901  ORF Transcript_5650/g.15901 Transcript_5650/m.15901 type:complete len:236 (-) Transcript_5650:735-1442(-)
MAGLKDGSAFLRSPTTALDSALCTPPATAPTPASCAAFTKKEATLELLEYALSGVVPSKTLFGSLDSMFCHSCLAGAGAARVGATKYTTAALAAANVSVLTATRSNCSQNLSPRTRASYMSEAPMVITCSSASFCMNAGSAMRRPTTFLETLGGSDLVIILVTFGLTSMDMNRTRAALENMPISAASRMILGRPSMVLYHSWRTALIAFGSYSSANTRLKNPSPSPSPSPSSSPK